MSLIKVLIISGNFQHFQKKNWGPVGGGPQLFCELEAHANFQNPMTIPSGREREREEPKEDKYQKLWPT
jgi:hypothetical protein